MGTKFAIGGKHQLGIDDVCFYGAGYSSYIRGIGAEVEFMAYPGALPFGLRIGDARAAVRKNIGKAMETQDDYDYLETETRVMSFQFARGKLVMMRVGRPR